MPAFKKIRRFFKLVSTSSIDPDEQYSRLKLMERDLGVPIKIFVLAITAYFLFFTDEFKGTQWLDVALEPVQEFFMGYVLINVGAIAFLLFFNRWPLRVVHWVTLVMNFVDAMVVSALVVITGGLDSMVYYVFVVLIIRNAISIPIPATQISMNLLTTAGYAAAIFIWKGWFSQVTGLDDDLSGVFPGAATVEEVAKANTLEQGQYESALFVIRVFFLVLMTALCYGVQVLFDRDQISQRESREYTLRREQLRSTGRLAAEIAHRLKNPLSIINNAAFSMQRHMGGRDENAAKQLDMIRSEVDRSDMILTELMGYARLSEGRVERLNVKEEMRFSIEDAFPAVSNFGITIKQQISDALPPLMMQRAHLREILVNVFVNAREATSKGGTIEISCKPSPNYTIEIRVKDSGVGVPKDQIARIFEAYFTTKEKGTGLGLAIVKQNTELYGGEIEVESELGTGTEFVLVFPTRALLQDNQS
jgi:signal transduction histidine kinase